MSVNEESTAVVITEDIIAEYDQKNSVDLDINEVKKIISRESYAEKDKLSKIDNPDDFYPRLKEFRDKHNDISKVNFIVEDINTFIETRFKKVMLMACRHYDNEKYIRDEKKKMLVEEQKLLDGIVESISQFKSSIF